MEINVNRKKLQIRLGFVTFLIYFLNWLAIKFYWYNSIWFFDMLMHFLGGVWVGLILLWVFPISAFSQKYFLKVILGILLVGVAWEFFEFVVNNMFAGNPFDLEDTMSDVFFDMFGGVLTMLYFSKRIMNKKEIEV